LSTLSITYPVVTNLDLDLVLDVDRCVWFEMVPSDWRVQVQDEV